MKQTVLVKSVNVIETESSSSIVLKLDKSVKGFRNDRDENNEVIEGTLKETDVREVSFFKSQLTAVLCDLNDDIAMVRAMLGKAFTSAHFGMFLTGAKIELDNVFVKKGDEIERGEGNEAAIAERDCYINYIKKVTFTERAKEMMQKCIEMMMMQACSVG